MVKIAKNVDHVVYGCPQKATGGLMQKSLPLICGGYDPTNNDRQSNCYIVGNDDPDPVTQLLQTRVYGASVVIGEGSKELLWVTGKTYFHVGYVTKIKFLTFITLMLWI